MLNTGTLSIFPPISTPSEYNFNDRFIYFNGSGYGSREALIYVDATCEVYISWGGYNNYGGVWWKAGKNTNQFSDNMVISINNNSGSGTYTLVGDRTYRFQVGGYSSGATWGLLADLKKGWVSSNRDAYLSWYSGGSWINNNWPITT